MVLPTWCLSGVEGEVDLLEDLPGVKKCLHFSVAADSFSLRKAIVAGYPTSHRLPEL